MAARLEKDHVHLVYSQIARHFSDTRYKPWPKIAEFLRSLPKGSLVADIGCGNGKYLGVNPLLCTLGSDICPELVSLACSRGHEVLISDCLHLPYRSCVFDAAICIAVIHHLSTDERRGQALQELMRVLRPGGRMLIYVWAMEQTRKKFTEQDVMVPWRLQPHYAGRCDKDQEEKDKGKASQGRRIHSAEPTNKLQSVSGESGSSCKDDDERCGSDCSVSSPLTPSKQADASVAQLSTELTHEEELGRLGYQTFQRYYHVFRKGELGALVHSATPTMNVVEEYYDHENWCVLAEKA